MHDRNHKTHHARIRAIRLGGRVGIAVLAAVTLVFLQRAMSQWVDRTAVFISGLALLVVFILLSDWVLDLVGPPLWRFLKSVTKTVVGALATDPEVIRFSRRYPAFSGWFRRRTTLSSPYGLYLTTTVLAALYFLGGFISIATDIVTAGSIIGYDRQLTALLTAFRNPEMTRFLWVFTVLGDVRVAFPLGFVVVVLLELWAHRRDALFFVVCVGGGAALGALAKLLFQRARPEEALALVVTPGSYSFPSGHALYSFLIAFSLAFVLARRARTFRAQLTALGVAAFFTLLTGLSRVYLGVHWMSDIVASWLLGLSWLTVCIGYLVAYERYIAGREPSTTDNVRPRRRITAVVAIVAALAVLYGAQQDPLLAQATQSPPAREWRVTIAADGTPRPTKAEASVLPRWSEKLDGSTMSPIGLIFIGTDTELLTAFDQARWQIAEKPTLTNVLRAAVAALADDPYPTAPVTPSFVRGRVHQIAFEKSVGTATARQRHHTRWWKTDFTVEGVPVWVATASLDAGVGIGSDIPLPTHVIAPEIDAEQRYIVGSLTRGGSARAAGTVRVTEPATGTNVAGDQWFTQGLATVLVPVP